MTRASEQDVEALIAFMNLAELALEKENFSLLSPEDNWTELDDDDADKKIILKIQHNLSKELGVDADDVDNRIVMYEFLARKFRDTRCGWSRVVSGYGPVVEAACDPTLSYLAFHPGFEFNHVEREM